jgi:phage shock protein PspC (stress-responsive transcriptional regulator)
MNKVINININGLVFYIDEEAFEILNTYLNALKRHFSTEEGGDEILADIESRIAEMLTERLKNRNEVVAIGDVQTVIAAMGQPEQMADSESGAKTASEQKSNSYSFEPGKRMYRDPDHKIIGGVCSGISEYLGLDPTWIRLIFVLAVFLGFGSGLLVYAVLWIILPEAKTPSEKLEMRGERVNISNIEKTVKENIDVIKDKFNKEFRHFESKDFKNRAQNFFEGVFEGISGAFGSVFYVFARLFSFLIAFISIMAIIAILCMILGSLGFISLSIPAITYDFFDSGQQAIAITVLLIIVISLPFIGLLFRATRYLAGYKRRNRTLGAIFGSIWIMAFIALAVLGLRGASKFSRSYSYSVTDQLKKPAHDTLYLAVNDNGTGIGYHGMGDIQLDHVLNHFRSAGDNNDLGIVSLDISRADDQNLSLEKYYHSRGETIKDAHDYASSIRYGFFQRDSLITFDEGFKIPPGSKWSGQNLSLNLQLPVGEVVVFKNGMEKIIYDIDNLTDTYDEDMIGHKWMMTAEGLKCLDCPTDSTGNRKRHHTRTYRRYWSHHFDW